MVNECKSERDFSSRSVPWDKSRDQLFTLRARQDHRPGDTPQRNSEGRQTPSPLLTISGRPLRTSSSPICDRCHRARNDGRETARNILRATRRGHWWSPRTWRTIRVCSVCKSIRFRWILHFPLCSRALNVESQPTTTTYLRLAFRTRKGDSQ